MPNRPRKTPANPGRASIDIGGIAGAFGAGGGAQLEEVPQEPTDVPMEGDVDAKMASGIREPIGSNLRAKKPGFWENALTKGQSGRDYRELDTQLQMQQMQNRFLAGQATQADLAALQRLQEEYRLRDEESKSEFERKRGAEEEDYKKSQEAYSQLRPTLAKMFANMGVTDVELPADVRQAGLLLGDTLKHSGLGTGLSNMRTTIGGNVVKDIQSDSQARIARTQPGYESEMQGYLASRRAPATTENLALRGAANTEANSAVSRVDMLGRQDLANRQFDFESTSPRMLGSNFMLKDGQIMAVTPGTEGGPAIATGPDGRPAVVNRPPTPAGLAPIGGRRPVGSIPPPSVQPPATQQMTAPQAQAPQMRQPIAQPIRPTGGAMNGVDMTPEMIAIAQSNRLPQDKVSILTPIAERAAKLQAIEEARRRRLEAGERRVPIGEILGF